MTFVLARFSFVCVLACLPGKKKTISNISTSTQETYDMADVYAELQSLLFKQGIQSFQIKVTDGVFLLKIKKE